MTFIDELAGHVGGEQRLLNTMVQEACRESDGD